MNFPAGQTLRANELDRDETVECDVVIIGSGAGGAATAAVLSGAGLKVAILEEGRKFEPEELSTKQSWALRNLYAERGSSVAMGNIYLPMPRGKAVGGSTLLNSAICFRTPKRVLDDWQMNYGLEWSDHAAMQPTFAEIEEAIGVEKTHPTQARTHNLIFKQGADALHIEGDFISRNAPGCIGCGMCQMGCPIGGKGSVDRNLIPTSVENGAALFTCTRATSLLIRNGAAVGVEAYGVDPLSETRLRKLTFTARKVFVCGGAVSTPLLLMRQGLCTSSGQLGQNLRAHTAQGVVARFEQVIDAWNGVPQGYYADLPGEHAVLETFSAVPEIYATQYEEFSKPIDRVRHLASTGCMIGDTASGSVSPGPSEQRAKMAYDTNREDQRVILKGLETIARIYFAAGALEVHLGFTRMGLFQNMQQVEKALRADIPLTEMGLYASHPMGTCRMHADKTKGVLKPTGETWDVQNLYVTDASVFPTSLGVNPQITIMTVATTLARMMLKAG